MTENRMDRVTDLLKERIYGVRDEVRKQFKGTNPYRMEKVEQFSEDELINQEIEALLGGRDARRTKG